MAFPESFNAAQRRLGRVQDQPYVPLSGRAATGVGATAVPQNKGAPPKASDAPKGNTQEIFAGLAEALNTNQRRLKEAGKYDIADEYVFEFSPPTMGEHKMKRPGTTDYGSTAMSDGTKNPAAALPDRNSMDTNSRTFSVSAGSQIVQVIDEIMRNSEYITNQQLYIVDEVTQKIKPNPNPPGNQLAWYKINFAAEDLGFDEKRRDHAYRMRYIITPYAINMMQSDWFPKSRYRGSHKSYNYWFTGQNNSILNFEQEFNSLYQLIMSGAAIPAQRLRSDFRDQARRIYLPVSEIHAKGAYAEANEGGDNAASFLYSPTDQGQVRLRIVGDPAWLAQGEVGPGVTAGNFNFAPFLNDGTINYDSQEIVFDISWNRPADYDFGTGLTDLNRSNFTPGGTYSSQPQENITYTAYRCKHSFSKGKFEQELEGKLLFELEQKTSTDGRTVAGNTTTSRSGTRDIDAIERGVDGVIDADVQNQETFTSPTADTEGGNGDSLPELLPSETPLPPDSDGDLIQLGGFEDQGTPTADNPQSQLMDRET